RNPLLDTNFDISGPGSPDMQATGFLRGATGRMPGFYRIDARIEKKWRVGSSGWVSFVIEALNATLQKEVVSETCGLSIVGVGGGGPPTRTASCKYNEIGPIT